MHETANLIREEPKMNDPLTTLLGSLDVMLEADDVPAVEEANKEIWDYLSAFDGISGQKQAIKELAEAFEMRAGGSVTHAMIGKHIDQHKRRLAEM
jgi:hypothetical protein